MSHRDISIASDWDLAPIFHCSSKSATCWVHFRKGQAVTVIIKVTGIHPVASIHVSAAAHHSPSSSWDILVCTKTVDWPTWETSPEPHWKKIRESPPKTKTVRKTATTETENKMDFRTSEKFLSWVYWKETVTRTVFPSFFFFNFFFYKCCQTEPRCTRGKRRL